MHPRIEKAAHRRGEYIGHCNGAQRIRKGGQGWQTYELGSTAGTFTPATAPTLRQLGDKLDKLDIHLPTEIEVKGVTVSLEWDKSADIRQDDDAIGEAVHTVDEVDLDAGIAPGPNDGEVIEIEGMKFRLGSHDYETSDGQVTCSAKIYRAL